MLGEKLQSFARDIRGLPVVQDQALQVDPHRFIFPYDGNNCFEGYEVQQTGIQFQSPDEIRELLEKMTERAQELGFDKKELNLYTDPSSNAHYGLLPSVDYAFSGDIQLKRRESTTATAYDEQFQLIDHPVHDDWRILVGNNGEVTSDYWEYLATSPRTYSRAVKFFETADLKTLLPPQQRSQT